MYKYFFLFIFFILVSWRLSAQEAFIINNYDVKMHINRDAVIDITETIDLTFTEDRHGIIRKIPFRYYAAGGEAQRPFKSDGDEIKIFLTNIEVENWEYDLSKDGDYEEIKIGSADKTVNGKQRYVLHYKAYNAINFFEDHSEFYWNIVGQEWNTQVENASFDVSWDEPLPADYQPAFFVATGSYGSTLQNADVKFGSDRRSFSGKTKVVLQSFEGMTVGFSFPKDFLQQTPIPPSVMAEKFYFKDEQISIKVLQNGASEVTERYTIVPVRRMNSITRYLYPYIKNQSSNFKDWLGGQSRYVVANVKVSGTKKCRSFKATTICLDISDLPVGEERTVEISYRTYGNFQQSTDDPNLLAYAFIPINQGIDEPVLQSEVQVELPDGNIQNAVLKSEIYNGDVLMHQTPVKQVDAHTLVADLGDQNAFLQPREKMIFQLDVPKTYFTKSVMSYDWRLFWLNNRYLFLPLLVFLGLYYIWNRWGRDEEFSKMVYYYPPDDVPPSEAGILIDDKLHDRDLLALIPYWGSKGYIEIEEVGTESIWKKDDYIFKLLKRIPANVPAYEKKMFDGIFGSSGEAGKEVKLSSLKNKFYTTMDKARKELEKEIKRKSFYMPYTRGAGTAMTVLGLIIGLSSIGLLVVGRFFGEELMSQELAFGLVGTGILSSIFGRIMPKKAPIGLEAYKQLAGFELFVKDAELPRLETFLKEDPNYFDKTLPYAIVFNHVEKWAKKFEALAAPPPNWYHSPRQDAFSAWVFTNQLSGAMRSMGDTFSSRPSSSGSGGSSFGGGGFSGGGFGGGGGSSW